MLRLAARTRRPPPRPSPSTFTTRLANASPSSSLSETTTIPLPTSSSTASTLSAALSSSSSPLTNTPDTVLSSISTSTADLFEDEIFNDMLSPRIKKIHQPSSPRPRKTHTRDTFLYGVLEQAAYKRQLQLEERGVEMATKQFQQDAKAASLRGDVVSLKPAADLFRAWFHPMGLAIRQQVDTMKQEKKKGRPTSETEAANLLSNFLTELPPEAMAVIAIHVVLASLMREAKGVSLTKLAMQIASNVQAEGNLKKISSLQREMDMLEKKKKHVQRDGQNVEVGIDGKKKNKDRKNVKNLLHRAMKNSHSVASAVNYAAQKAAVKNAERSSRELLLLGTKLIEVLMSVAKVQNQDGSFVPALTHFYETNRFKRTTVGMLQLADEAVGLIDSKMDGLPPFLVAKHQPMIVRPRPWTAPNEGAYLRGTSNLVRSASVVRKSLDDALAAADLSTLYKGLNALGDQEWRVNTLILDTAEELWKTDVTIPGLVTMKDRPIPEKKTFLAKERELFDMQKAEKESNDIHDDTEFDEKVALRRLRSERRKAQKINRELFSMRADTSHRLQEARQFANEERLWLPHNVDFRGRAYPMPVHLQHMGSDLTRALLTFANPGVELGPRGVYWLKIHLANQLGADKLSFDERIVCAEDAMAKAIEAGRNPTSESSIAFWSDAEDPFQLLAVCGELATGVGRYGGQAALESFRSTLPITMDGSCNGLQHYAALGRDQAGGEQVNLVPNCRPQDVYSGIGKLVSDKVDQLAVEGDEIGQLLQGKISRKVVKQTVMTSVYGVTLIGARHQIGNRLAEIPGFPEEKVFTASIKLASLTMSSLGDIFSGATRTMDWLYKAADDIARQGYEVQWTTPVGLPVIQPYRESERMIVRTLMQKISLEKKGAHTPVSPIRQRSAFAPNFVHSVDSAHMLLTGIECRRRGLNFAAVHDSFWTNAAHVDTMNEVLRTEFVKLHERDLLDELRESFLLRYPNMKFDAIPPRGNLDLNAVRESDYFFS